MTSEYCKSLHPGSIPGQASSFPLGESPSEDLPNGNIADTGGQVRDHESRPNPELCSADVPLTEAWLAAAGFKWSQEERQPQKHWRLWLGWAANPRNACIDDLGLEVSMAWWPGRSGQKVGDAEAWHCWIVSGPGGGRASIHVRYLRTVGDVIGLLEALTGREWDPTLSRYGNLYTPDQAARLTP